MQPLTTFRSIQQPQRPLAAGRQSGTLPPAARNANATAGPLRSDLNPPRWEDLLGRR